MSSKMKLKLVLSGAIAMGLTSCGKSSPITRGAQGGNSSDLTAVNITLPDRSVLKAQVADIETKMNAYRLIIKTTGSDCANPINVDKVDTFSQSPTLTASLQQGCDYELGLELGNKVASIVVPDVDKKVTYDSKIKDYMERACVSCHVANAQGISDLTNFSSVKAVASAIYDRVVIKGNMPKGQAPSAEDKAMITAWKEAGYLEKDEASQSQPGPVDKLTAIYYKNNTNHVINKADIQGQATFKVNLKLQLQEAGRDIGLGTSSIEKPDTGGAIPGVQKPFTLTGNRNLKLANASGTVSLNDLVKGKKLIIDVSTTSCSTCVTEGIALNRSPAHQAAMDDSKCSYVTITRDKNDLNGWNRHFNGTYVGKNSYYLAPSDGDPQLLLQDIYWKIFPTTSRGTPTFIVISEDGKVERFGNTLKSIIDECK